MSLYNISNFIQTRQWPVKLAPFWPADLAIWFAQLEAQFVTRNITQQKTWFHYVIDALDSEEAAEVRDLVLHPPKDAPYMCAIVLGGFWPSTR